jgi:SAM-dependent methyltransferase
MGGGLGYRERLYARYASGGPASVPESLSGLRPRAPYLRRLVARHFPADRDAAILDVGCGHGALLHFAREAGYCNLAGVDVSAEQVEAARRLGIEGVEQGDLMDALRELPEASRDVVVSFDLIEHLDRDELLDFVDAVHRVLRPGGLWIVHAPNAESPLFGRTRYGDLTHELAVTAESLSQLVFSSGFRSIECFEEAPVCHGVKSALRWVLWKFFRSVLSLYLAAESGDAGLRAIFSQSLLGVVRK